MTTPICTMCDDTGFKDHAGFAMDPCDHQQPTPAADKVEAVGFLRDLADRLCKIPCVHHDGYDIDRLRELAVAMQARPAGPAGEEPVSLERAAEALHKLDHPDASPAALKWSAFSEEWKETYRQRVRVAVKAYGDTEPVGYTGNGSLDGIKHGLEGSIWGTPEASHPIPLYARPATPTNPERLVMALRKARKLVRQAQDARGRAYRRTGGTKTAEREFETAARYDDKADEQFSIIEAALSAGQDQGESA